MARSPRELWTRNLVLQDRNVTALEKSYASLATSQAQADDLRVSVQRTKELIATSRRWIKEQSGNRY